MACALAKSYGLSATSAGLFARPQEPASQKAIDVCADIGLDLTDHRSRLIDQAMIDKADLVLTMTMDQAESLRPLAGEKVQALMSYAGDQVGDIDDPFARSLSHYRHTLMVIRDLIEALAKKVEDK